jgi:hypothetical protein
VSINSGKAQPHIVKKQLVFIVSKTIKKDQKILSIIGIITPFISPGIIMLSLLIRSFIVFDADVYALIGILLWPILTFSGLILSCISFWSSVSKKYKIISLIGCILNLISLIGSIYIFSDLTL